MATVQEILSNFESLDVDDQIYFFDSLNKKKNTVLIERESLVRQHEKDKLYETKTALKNENVELKRKVQEMTERLENPDTPPAPTHQQEGNDNSMNEAEKEQFAAMQEAVAAAQREAAEAKMQTMKMTVFADLQVPAKLRPYVNGNTIEELTASAQSLIDATNEFHTSRLEQFKQEHEFDKWQEYRTAPPAPPEAPAAPPEGGLDPNTQQPYDNIIQTAPPFSPSHGQPSGPSNEEIRKMSRKDYGANREALLAAERERLSALPIQKI